MKRKVLVDPIHGFEWCIQVGGLKNTAIKWYIKKYKLSPPSEDVDNYAGCFSYNTSVPYTGLLWVQEKAALSTICHEVAHAVMHVCRLLELDPRQADEFQADYHGFLCRGVCNIN